jgi:TatD DNase family protein
MLNPTLFDIHTHVHFAAFAEDKNAVIQRALDAGVWMINVGTQRDTSRMAIETADAYDTGVYAAVGLHPIHTEKSYHDTQELGSDGAEFVSRGEMFSYDYYKKLAVHKKVVAIGECGLDYYRLGEDTKQTQSNTFLRHIQLAHDIQKPLMIHCRNAFNDLIAILKSNFKYLKSNDPGVIHFFTGSTDDAKKLLDLGFLFSFGGVVTFARDYDDVLRYIPLDRIVLETDAPYVAPIPYRGKRNEPVYIAEVAKKISEVISIPEKTISTETTKNALRLFVTARAPCETT